MLVSKEKIGTCLSRIHSKSCLRHLSSSWERMLREERTWDLSWTREELRQSVSQGNQALRELEPWVNKALPQWMLSGNQLCLLVNSLPLSLIKMEVSSMFSSVVDKSFKIQMGRSILYTKHLSKQEKLCFSALQMVSLLKSSRIQWP